MFDKKDSSSGARGGVNALLGEGAEFQGKLTFSGTVRIDGIFTGEISSQGNLIVGEKAMLKATIEVGGLEVAGQVHGNINAKTRIDIRSKGRIEGDIDTPLLTVEEGGQFEGNSRMAGAVKNLNAVNRDFPIKPAKTAEERK